MISLSFSLQFLMIFTCQFFKFKTLQKQSYANAMFWYFSLTKTCYCFLYKPIYAPCKNDFIQKMVLTIKAADIFWNLRLPHRVHASLAMLCWYSWDFLRYIEKNTLGGKKRQCFLIIHLTFFILQCWQLSDQK